MWFPSTPGRFPTNASPGAYRLSGLSRLVIHLRRRSRIKGASCQRWGFSQTPNCPALSLTGGYSSLCAGGLPELHPSGFQRCREARGNAPLAVLTRARIMSSGVLSRPRNCIEQKRGNSHTIRLHLHRTTPQYHIGNLPESALSLVALIWYWLGSPQEIINRLVILDLL